ncbi:MAG TPA: type IV secretion system DNA-binding domain-containing protein [Candidatus Saccharimonadales bacterium]|nr:type IV secretion system DNA-binding domain-containing protein [Candidatus Saccharimonadales bacterium]
MQFGTVTTANVLSIILAIVLIVVGIALLAGILWGLFYIFVLWLRYRNRESISLNSVLLQVTVPRENETKIDAAEQLFASLYALYGTTKFEYFKPQPHVSFEIVGLPGDIRFYVNVPAKYRDFIEKEINGAYPEADILPVNDPAAKQRDGSVIGTEYNIFSENGKVAFMWMNLKGADYLPLKVYKDLPVDPLSTITSILGKMREGEGAAIQILIQPADNHWKKVGRSYIGGIKKAESNPDKASYKTDAKELEAVENKISKPGFNTTIRVVVCAQTQEEANAHINNIKGAFSQFNGMNSFKKRMQFFRGLFMTDFIYRYFPMFRGTSVLTSEELASIYHFPNKSIMTPGIHWLHAKRSAAPSNIPTTGLYLGRSVYRGLAQPIFIERDDRRRHSYIIGKTGTGKTEFLKSMIIQDINNGEGVAVIDPHGDLVEDVLKLIPPKRAEDVILFDPSDYERPMGFNMLEADTEQQKHFAANSIIGLMYKLFDPNKTGIVGPRFEHAVRNAMLSVMYEKGSTLIEVMRILTDQAYVQEVLPKIEDPIIRRYWTDQIAQTSDFHKSEVLDYITSKFGRFVTNKMIRNIIGQSDSAFSFRKVMDEQKILLINLSKGTIGEENSNFLGLVLVPKILVAAMSRQDMPMADRKDFFLYVDEFQNFATPDFAQILSEARKYRLNLIVANQFIGQMEEEIKNAIFGNVGTVSSFRVGVTDANYLAHEFQPIFNEQDLINVDKYNCYMRTLVNGEPVRPFSLDTTKDVAKEKALENPRVAELVRELSRLKYGKSVQTVETEIAQRARL